MHFTEGQKFVYALMGAIFFTIALLVLTNTYALDIFLVLLIIEFLIVSEVTKPFGLNASWRKNIAFFAGVLLVVLAVIVYQRAKYF